MLKLRIVTPGDLSLPENQQHFLFYKIIRGHLRATDAENA